MANEVQMAGPGVGRTCYFRVWNQTSGFVWNTSGGVGAFEGYNAANITSYGISFTEKGSSNFYVGSFPSAIPAGVYSVEGLQQTGGSEAEADPIVGQGDIQWNGTKVFSLSDIPVSGFVVGIRLQRGSMVRNFGLYFKSAADHITPFVSGVISGQISKDGGNWTFLQSGAFTELGYGAYSLQALTSGDTLCNTAMLLFTATGISGGTADPLPMSIVFQASSGQ